LMRSLSFGHAAFALGMVLLGITGLALGDVVAVFEPWPPMAPARALFGYVSALVSLGCGAGLLWPRAALTAAPSGSVLLLLGMLILRAPVSVFARKIAVSWESCGEIAVVFAAGWILSIRLRPSHGGRSGWLQGQMALRAARWLFALALVTFGVSHFV